MLLGDRAGRLDRNQHRRTLRVLREEAAQQRQIFFGQGNDDQDRTHLLGVERAPRLSQREVAERHIGAAEIIFVGQNADDLPVHLASDHADR